MHIVKSTGNCALQYGCRYAQVDILSSDEEVQEVVDFVAQNAKRLLGVETAQVLRGRACLGTTCLCPFDHAPSWRHVSLRCCWSCACRDGKSAALQVLPVAARKALAAKLSVGGTLPGGDADPARTLQTQLHTACSCTKSPVRGISANLSLHLLADGHLTGDQHLLEERVGLTHTNRTRHGIDVVLNTLIRRSAQQQGGAAAVRGRAVAG